MIQRFSISREEILPKYGMPLDAATQRDLGAAIYSIVFGMAYFIITGYPGASPLFTSFLKDYLGVSDSAYGLILTLPFITVLVQVPFTIYVARHGRIKQSFLLAGTLAKVTFLTLAFLPILGSRLSSQASFLVVVVTIILTSTFNWIADSAINTWFGSLIPTEIKGRYFSTRQMIFTIAMLFYALTMSQLLQLLRDWRWKYTLFFGLAVLFGLIDILFYTKVRPPEKAYLPWFHTSPEQKRQTFTMQQFLMPLRDTRYRAYLLFTISWSFSMQISGPYYNVYMFNDLKFTLGQMTLLSQIIPAIATILFLRRIGRAFDHYGFKPILILSCGVSLVLPITWMFATVDSNWFVYLSNVLSGIFNIGIDLAIMSLAIFLAPHAERSAYLAMKSIAMALLGFVPAILLGGFLSDLLRPVLLAAELPFFRGQVMNPFHVLLILTFSLRLMTLLVFARRLHEPTAMTFSDFVAHANASHRAQLRRQRVLLREKRRRLKQRLNPRKK